MQTIWAESDGWNDGETVCGIWRTEGGTYLACTYATSKTFKTLRSAMRWMVARGFEPRIDVTPEVN